MPLGARLAVNTHNMGGRFVDAQWSMSTQEAGDALESIVEFQVQIKGHNHREYEDKWQGSQNFDDGQIEGLGGLVQVEGKRHEEQRPFEVDGKEISSNRSKQTKAKQERRRIRKEARGSQCAGKRGGNRATSNAQ